MEETKHILDQETKEKLKCLINFDPKQTYEYRPLQNGQVPEEYEPVFYFKLFSESEQYKMAEYLRRYSYMTQQEHKDFIDFTRHKVTGWKNIIDKDGNNFCHLTCEEGTSEEQWKSINMYLKTKIAREICKFSGLTEPEKLALK